MPRSGFGASAVLELASHLRKLSIARSTRSRATVSLFRGRDAEIWLVDLARAQATVSDAIEQPREPTDGALMIRTAELLRARLLLRLPRSATVETQRAMDPPPRDRIWLEAGGGAAFAPGGSLPMIGCAWVGAGWVTRPWLVLELTAMLPLHATRVDGPEGRADVFIGLIAAEARLLLRPHGVRVLPSLGFGIGAGFTRMRGEAIKPYENGDDWLTTLVAYGRPTVAIRLWRSLQLRFDGVIGVAAPRPVISFAGRTAAFWGRPLIAATLGVAVAL